MTETPGLRARKKARTRQLISEAAWGLFSTRGFDRVTVADVARVADVSEATVFNYFPAKEDLVFERMAAFEERMIDAVRARPVGQSVVAAFGQFVLEPGGLLTAGDSAAEQELAAAIRLILGSAALLDRERELFERYARSLAALVADERGLPPDDIEAAVIANALGGLHRALLDEVRRRVMAGEPRETIVAAIRASGSRALRRLEAGLDADLDADLSDGILV